MKEEDALKYDEPPAWMIPVRHSLGAVLMKAGRFAEAEQVYRDDLARLPDNGWSLFGLAESLRRQKKNEAEAAAVQGKFQKTWARADLKIATSCLCQARKYEGAKLFSLSKSGGLQPPFCWSTKKIAAPC